MGGWSSLGAGHLPLHRGGWCVAPGDLRESGCMPGCPRFFVCVSVCLCICLNMCDSRWCGPQACGALGPALGSSLADGTQQATVPSPLVPWFLCSTSSAVCWAGAWLSCDRLPVFSLPCLMGVTGCLGWAPFLSAPNLWAGCGCGPLPSLLYTIHVIPLAYD